MILSRLGGTCMSDDRRSYERFKVNNKPISVFIDGVEYSGKIENVSESGLGIIINHNFKVKKAVDYQFCYTSKKYDGSESFHVVNGHGAVVRSTSRENDSESSVGFRITPNDELSMYVRKLICQVAC